MSSRLRVDHKLGPLHWDILDILQRADEWVSSQALHAGLRPGYGHSDAAAKTIQRALRRLLDAGFIEGRGRGSARAWRRFPDRSPNRTEVQSVELAVALLQLEQFAATQLPSDALQILRDHCDRSRELLDSHPTYPRYRQGRAWLGKAAVVDSGCSAAAAAHGDNRIATLPRRAHGFDGSQARSNWLGRALRSMPRHPRASASGLPAWRRHPHANANPVCCL
ncbi:hypothetical protein [Bordetella bronchiseptica]|uniref:hypothetical protein n=1 Tax=Bordetella bronchiseptica TaxID=518 RepID=UPI000F681D4D|nr:hypothetical protein [Bordetella bronchiseptica]QET73225.1 hypothetical protein FOB42_24010 [Bordetella bronchiseptica]QIY01954.1 hypothetical protein FOC01_18180 [Bordetella bronchiseptica]